jgi:phosphate transport system substrate-binding protein
MKATKIFCYTLLFCLTGILVGPCGAQEKGVWKIGGASLYSTALEQFGASYQQTNSDCRPVIVTSSAGKGIEQLISGEVNLVASSRTLTADERDLAAKKNIQLAEKQVGQSTLAIVVSVKNPVDELTVEQVRRIFMGEITSWKEVGGPDEPIRVTTRAIPESGAGVFFQQEILRGAPYARNVQVMQSYKTTVTVAAHPQAIGYLPTSSAYYTGMNAAGVKEVKIKATESAPALSAPVGVVRETAFPIKVPLVLIWNKQANHPCVSGFVELIENKLRETSTEHIPDATGPKKMIASSSFLNRF